MTRDELTNRVIELFPPLAQVKPWEWAETDEGEPVVCIERHATFTGLDTGDIDLTTTVRARRRSASGGSTRPTATT